MAGRKTTPRETLMETRRKFAKSDGIVELGEYSAYRNNECLVAAVPPLAQQLLDIDEESSVKRYLDMENQTLITKVDSND